MCGYSLGKGQRENNMGVEVMRMLGIDEHQNIVYEGAACVGYPISPTPTIVATRVVSVLDEEMRGESNLDLRTSPLLFREDAFDPVARIRRGRFYINNGVQTIRWRAFRDRCGPSLSR